MRWFKVAAIAAGALITCLVISWIIGFIMQAAIVAIIITVIVLAVKVASGRRPVSPKRPDRGIGEIRDRSRIFRPDLRDVDDALARLKREMDN